MPFKLCCKAYSDKHIGTPKKKNFHQKGLVVGVHLIPVRPTPCTSDTNFCVSIIVKSLDIIGVRLQYAYWQARLSQIGMFGMLYTQVGMACGLTHQQSNWWHLLFCHFSVRHVDFCSAEKLCGARLLSLHKQLRYIFIQTCKEVINIPKVLSWQVIICVNKLFI